MNETPNQPNQPDPASQADAESQAGTGPAAGAEQAGEQAQRIAAEGRDVRERVRRLVVDTVQERRLSFDELNDVARHVIEGASAGVKQATPEQQRTVLRSVIDGLADSYATAANATRLALEEANQRGRSFAQEDLQRAVRDLRALDERFVRTVTRTTERTWSTMTEQLGAFREHAQRAAQGIRPSMSSALNAARRHPGQLAGEAASAGVTASRQAAGHLLQAMAGLLQGAGDVLIKPGENDARDTPETN